MKGLFDLTRLYLLLFVNGQARTGHGELDHKHQEQDNHVLISQELRRDKEIDTQHDMMNLGLSWRSYYWAAEQRARWMALLRSENGHRASYCMFMENEGEQTKAIKGREDRWALTSLKQWKCIWLQSWLFGNISLSPRIKVAKFKSPKKNQQLTFMHYPVCSWDWCCNIC